MVSDMGGRKSRQKRIQETTIFVKPLSVNMCWQGRRYKTPNYKAYEKKVLELLPEDLYLPKNGKLVVYITFGFSSKMSDYDNAIKPFQDILQKKYGFDDNRIYEAHIFKEITEKGHEFIRVRIEKIKETTRSRKDNGGGSE